MARRNSRESEHLAYLKILSGRHEIISFFFSWLCSKPEEILSQAQKNLISDELINNLWGSFNLGDRFFSNPGWFFWDSLLITCCLVLPTNTTWAWFWLAKLIVSSPKAQMQNSGVFFFFYFAARSTAVNMHMCCSSVDCTMWAWIWVSEEEDKTALGLSSSHLNCGKVTATIKEQKSSYVAGGPNIGANLLFIMCSGIIKSCTVCSAMMLLWEDPALYHNRGKHLLAVLATTVLTKNL